MGVFRAVRLVMALVLLGIGLYIGYSLQDAGVWNIDDQNVWIMVGSILISLMILWMDW
jgi:hypothetical protein